MWHGSEREVMWFREAGRVHESGRVGQEQVSFSRGLEEVEGIIVEDAVLDILVALNQ